MYRKCTDFRGFMINMPPDSYILSFLTNLLLSQGGIFKNNNDKDENKCVGKQNEISHDVHRD